MSVPLSDTAGLLFKATHKGRLPTLARGTGFVWPKPSGARPGKWTDRITEPVLCESGYHLTDAAHLVDWLSDELWIAEGRGARVDAADKTVFESARLIRPLPWDARVARLFAADCAEHVLHLFEAVMPGDDRPRLAIQAARDCADSKIGAAARAAAWDAAGDAAGAAAGDAAGAAAGAAAWAATGAATRDAEKTWQNDTLLKALGLDAA